MQPIEKETEVILKFAEVERIAPPAIQLDEVTFSYAAGTRVVLNRINLSANSESRICIVRSFYFKLLHITLNFYTQRLIPNLHSKDSFFIVTLYHFCQVGENGAGKTTLLKILTGELNLTAGLRNTSRQLRIGYFSQHHVDQLDLSVCPVELLQNRFPGL